MELLSKNLNFMFKMLFIGVALIMSFAASLSVQSVVNDRIEHQEIALKNQSIDKILIF